MTASKCTYCGEHHHYQHELVCDNVRQLYPLHKTAIDRMERESNPAILDKMFMDTIKALNGDIIHLNTELLEEKKQHRMTQSRLDIANAKIKAHQGRITELRSINAMKSNQGSNPPS